jgi:predicted NBD/HSP70 family sugar kinase
MIERGHVLNGRDSLIGEIGHAVISDSASTTCTCGKSGCLESMVSIGHVRKMLAKAGDHGFDNLENVTFQTLFAASSEGNVAAKKIVAYLAHCFAAVLHNLALTYNQDMVIFQGDFAYADQHFDECLKAELQQFRYFPNDSRMTVLTTNVN